jgi:hypothetical protein
LKTHLIENHLKKISHLINNMNASKVNIDIFCSLLQKAKVAINFFNVLKIEMFIKKIDNQYEDNL